jgi:hypothetical protein
MYALTSAGRFISRLSGAIVDLHQRFRSVRLRWILLTTFIVSVGLVAIHLPLRWQGGRTAQNADIPLRPMTPLEAAALLSGGSDGERLAGVVRLTASEVTVRTRVYPLVSDVSLGECSRRATYRNTIYQICSSSWEGYHNVHVVSRGALEKELGRRLTERDLTPDYLGDSIASFASNRLPLYFATEVAFLTAWLTGLISLLRRIRNPLLVPPLVSVAGMGALLFVPYYSPAFIDADWFYQRIALEEVIGGRGPLGLSFLAVMVVAVPLTALCLPLYALTLAVRGLRRVSGLTATRVWMAVTGVLIAALSTELGVEYQRYWAERQRTVEALNRFESALGARALTVLKTDPALTKQGVEFLKSRALAPSAEATTESIVSAAGPAQEGRVFIPLDGGWYAFLWTNAHFKYGDVRQLRGTDGTEVNDYDVVEHLVRTGEPYETSFWQYLGSTYLAGRAFNGTEHRITAVALVGSETEPLDALQFRWWWRLFFGRTMFIGSSEVRPLRGVRQ